MIALTQEHASSDAHKMALGKPLLVASFFDVIPYPTLEDNVYRKKFKNNKSEAHGGTHIWLSPSPAISSNSTDIGVLMDAIENRIDLCGTIT